MNEIVLIILLEDAHTSRVDKTQIVQRCSVDGRRDLGQGDPVQAFDQFDRPFFADERKILIVDRKVDGGSVACDGLRD